MVKIKELFGLIEELDILIGYVSVRFVATLSAFLDCTRGRGQVVLRKTSDDGQRQREIMSSLFWHLSVQRTPTPQLP